MYTNVTQFFDKLSAPSTDAINLSLKETRVITGVLLFYSMQVDGRILNEEITAFRKICETHLSIREEEMLQFENLISNRFYESQDLEKFTDSLQSLPKGEKQKILDFMRDIALCDQQFHESEINLVAETTKLLGMK